MAGWRVRMLPVCWPERARGEGLWVVEGFYTRQNSLLQNM